MEPILLFLGTLAAVAAVPVTWIIAKKQGVFDRTAVKIRLHNLPEEGRIRPELVVGGPHSEHNILTPILVCISNSGTATASDIEVALESESSTVVNHPAFFISPIATSSTESVEGNTIYLGNGVFRRVFKIAHLHPGKSVQLNNAGLPRNAVSKANPVAFCTLSVTVFEKGRSSRKCEFGIWHLDTTEDSFRNALGKLAQTAKNEFNSKSRMNRFMARLRHRRHRHPLQLVEITKLRDVSAPKEADTFETAEKIETSFGVRLVTGYLFVGPIGFV